MNTNLKPQLKKIEPEFGSSFVLRNLTESRNGGKPNWHYHREIELVYIEKGKGKRHIGNHVSYFNDGDLIMIGSNLPHYGFPSGLSVTNQEIFMQIHESCFGTGFLDMVETSSIKSLFAKSKFGLSFYGGIKNEVGERLKSMFYMSSFEKMMEVIKIFHQLSLTEEYNLLNAEGQTLEFSGTDINRIDLIYEHVRNNFESKIFLEEIAETTNMTVPALCRFFKKSTGKTFVQFLNEYRITHACKIISEESKNITDLAFECGFNNLSNFNRTFKKVTGKSPSEYRKIVKHTIS